MTRMSGGNSAMFKTYVFPLLFFKRISDVHDEEYAAALAEANGDEEYAKFPQNYRFQIPDDCHWNDVRAVASNVGHPGKLGGELHARDVVDDQVAHRQSAHRQPVVSALPVTGCVYVPFTRKNPFVAAAGSGV